MRFSIITATKGRPQWLLRAWRSVIAQTHHDFEWVIVDGTPGGYRGFLTNRLAEDPRIHHHRIENSGPAEGFQLALERASGEIIHPLADDDELVPNALQRVNEEIGDAAWLVAATDLRDTNGNVFARRGGNPDMVSMTRAGEYMLGGAVYWKRWLTDELGGFNQDYDGAADFELYLRFCRHSDPVVIPDVLYLYTDHPDTDSRQNAGRQRAQSARIRARA